VSPVASEQIEEALMVFADLIEQKNGQPPKRLPVHNLRYRAKLF